MPLAAVVIAIFAGSALAGIKGQLGILDLSGTNPATGVPWVLGDTYHFVFITSTNQGATSSNIGDYNALVQGLADAAGLGEAVWKVIGSTDTMDARDNTSTNPTVGTGCPILLVDGTTVVATDYADLWDGEVQNTISIDENGTAKDHWPFTGTYLDGTKSSGHSESGAALGGPGEVGQGESAVTTNWIWRQWTYDPATTLLPLYALSEPLVITGDATIPDVTGQLQATAESNLVAAGFIVGDVTTTYSDMVASGNVISQGAVGPATSGTAVDLVVSLGVANVACLEGDIDGNCIVTTESMIY